MVGIRRGEKRNKGAERGNGKNIVAKERKFKVCRTSNDETLGFRKWISS